MAIQVREIPYDWRDGSCSLRITGYNERDLAHLVQVLQAMGLDVDVMELARGRAQLDFSHLPSRVEAERIRTRGAGRPKKALCLPESSVFNYDTPVAEAVAWLDAGHTVEEGMEALGIASRTTYYRRVRDIRRALEIQEARTAGRMADPARRDLGPVVYTLADVTNVR